MIEHIDSFSLVLWGVFFLAAGLYPLGFMLGAPCSPCCGGQCGDPPVEFNRCIRFVNTDTSAPPTNTTTEPLHGYSRAVTRPEHVGAVLVPTTIEVSCGAWINKYVRNMADGETRTGVYRIYYKSPSNADIGTAVQWTITLRGVAIPNGSTATTPPVFGEDANGKTVTIYSDNAPLDDYEYQEKLISFPSVEVSPVGEQLRASLVLQATEAQGLRQSFANTYNEVFAKKTLKSGWIMRPFDFGGGYFFDGPYHPAENQWNYNVSEVESFLSGDLTVPYNSGSTSDPTRLLYSAPPSTTWTMQVSDPTAFCGFPLCSRNVFISGSGSGYSGAMYGGVIESTVTVQTAAWPETLQSSSSDYSRTYTNRCYGQETPPVMSLRLSPGECSYSGSHTSCINYSSAIGYNQGGGYYINRYGQGDGVPLTRTKGMPARVFYCGDLLWVIENGPCRTVVASPYQSWGDETYTLGGQGSASWTNSRCAFSGVDQDGKCHPLEATVTLDEDMLVTRPGGLEYGSMIAGKIVAADYVMQLAAFGSLYDTNCNQQVFNLLFPVVPIGVPILTSWFMSLVRRREIWCGQWDSSGYYLGAFNVPYTLSRAGQPVSGLTAVSIGGQVWSGLPPFPGSVVFGEQSNPYPTSVTPQSLTIGKDGGDVSLSRCCPETTQSVIIPANSSRFARTMSIEANGVEGRGATAYVTQDGYEGTACPFSVAWLAGSTGYPSYAGNPARVFSSDSCPIVGQVSHAEQPECEWSVESGTDWIVVDKTPEGLLSVSIDASITPSFSGSFGAYYKPYRAGEITITSEGTTAVWSIIQIQP